MTDKFSIIPFRQLFKIIVDQLDNKHRFFGIPEDVFFKPGKNDPFRVQRYGQLLETPIGVAAGPHTQLAQNIVASWLCGARYIELKTIQTLDELEVSKPCIDMQDEGYNCEWSQELKIPESYDQYLNAWILIHILKDKFGWDKNEGLGTIFNMSVGYDLQGVMTENVQWFFKKMKNCSIEKEKKINEIEDLYPRVSNLSIPDCISDNVTLSTMHGCPPDEIESIGKYLIEEKKLHTTVKLNPTLLGKDKLNDIIENSGFETKVPDIAFGHDLKYPEAVKIISNLRQSATKSKVSFGLKLTNTLESLNHKNVFPANEEMMYMSGKALHPISINLASKLQNDFNGELDISFSGGIDVFNIHNVVSCGLVPATVCSDILKPGGYGLLNQYLVNLKNQFEIKRTSSLNNYFLANTANNNQGITKAKLENLNRYASEVLQNKDYKKKHLFDPSIKTNRKLGFFDCINAPCVDTCPTNQDIPDYMYYTSKGDFQSAFDVIMRMNPFPNTTGMVCDRLCQTKCTRINYDSPVLIREIKRFVAEQSSKDNGTFFKKYCSDRKNNIKVAIIGAGPSGLSCAYFLALAGFDVDVYENKDQPGGMVSGAIPSFRLTNKAFKKDIERIEQTGVKINYNSKITKSTFEQLRVNNRFIYIATGAQKSRRFNIEGIDSQGVFDPLKLLFDVKNDKQTDIGNNVAIIGGGNTAMDAARTVSRLVGENGKVTIIYRRRIKDMPADEGEIKAVMDEGIEIRELTLPVKINNLNDRVSSIISVRMKLGDADKSGRPKPVEIPNSEFEQEFDTVIPAIGQDLEIDFIDQSLLKSEPGFYETKIPNVFIGGDAMRGASTAINAIGDGRKAAERITEKAGVEFKTSLSGNRQKADVNELMTKRMFKELPVQIKETPLDFRKKFNLVTSSLSEKDAIKEASRCLLCDEVCNTCVTVCPNLALYSYSVKPFSIELQKIVHTNGSFKITKDGKFKIEQEHQILHIADWCNECGNCTTFCPTSGSPYKDKPHLYLSESAFNKDNTGYFYDNENKTLIYKENGSTYKLTDKAKKFEYLEDNSKIYLDKKSFEIIHYEINDNLSEIKTYKAVEMSIILEGAKEFYGRT